MSLLLIHYQSEFNCFDKLKRKVTFLTKNIHINKIIFLDDSRGFISKLAKELHIDSESTVSEDMADFAIIFKDKRASLEHFKFKPSAKIKIINVQLTTVTNKDRDNNYDIYIGRGSIWGNPYQIGIDGDRDEVIRKYKYDFDRGFLRPFDDIDKNINEIKGKVIACHCKPLKCHGDIIADYVNSIDDGE
ncbi:DUF4326 domain-containing protein [Edwardsiella ictaluri]|nr:DUF4326 domain-containing protein [Edwardsiella ictaluri]EKS7778154.1 DUF4326 domain-containing protein [Edwardsiella ictaluri]EKS7791615.1 DUF4326 domain-containing protein [Edwardsiella ictaluri]EKS7798294.1 DUF4326 domain-containing protein [Edwardsiella ictaluri]EKS7811457.1 DUF4326 domain-containing protein [Edwardsiella ictaluri]